MADIQVHCQALQKMWDEQFPMVHAMGVRIDNYADHTLQTRTPLAGNTNIHGTAFAGSMYAIEALTAWGLIYLESAVAGHEVSIIHAAGRIEFAEPVTGDIVAICSMGDQLEAIAELSRNGKTRLELSSEVMAEGKVVSRFSGDYVVRLAET